MIMLIDILRNQPAAQEGLKRLGFDPETLEPSESMVRAIAIAVINDLNRFKENPNLLDNQTAMRQFIQDAIILQALFPETELAQPESQAQQLEEVAPSEDPRTNGFERAVNRIVFNRELGPVLATEALYKLLTETLQAAGLEVEVDNPRFALTKEQVAKFVEYFFLAKPTGIPELRLDVKKGDHQAQVVVISYNPNGSRKSVIFGGPGSRPFAQELVATYEHNHSKVTE
jgi:hypothetical protein